MTGLRHTLRSRPWLAALILTAALLLRVLVPAGFMPTALDGRVTLAICDGSGALALAPAMHGMHHAPKHAATKNPCAFADLSVPALGSVPPILLAAAIAFALASALTRRMPLAPLPAAHVRPPSQGPPVSV